MLVFNLSKNGNMKPIVIVYYKEIIKQFLSLFNRSEVWVLSSIKV